MNEPLRTEIINMLVEAESAMAIKYGVCDRSVMRWQMSPSMFDKLAQNLDTKRGDMSFSDMSFKPNKIFFRGIEVERINIGNELRLVIIEHPEPRVFRAPV